MEVVIPFGGRLLGAFLANAGFTVSCCFIILGWCCELSLNNPLGMELLHLSGSPCASDVLEGHTKSGNAPCPCSWRPG